MAHPAPPVSPAPHRPAASISPAVEKTGPGRPLGLVLAALLAMVFASAPLLAYIVVLKDGTQITTSTKYERQGDSVILTLMSGTRTEYPASDIDFARTDELNDGVNFSNARVLENGTAQRIDRNVPTETDEKSFAELVSERSGGGLALPAQSRRPEETEAAPEKQLPRTTAGFVDFKALRRAPFADDDMTSEIIRYLRGQGHDSVRVYQGTAGDRPLVEITTASEASVFKALRDAANCLVQKDERLSGIDLLLLGTDSNRAGQFSLDREMASNLASGQIEPSEFFLAFVEF